MKINRNIELLSEIVNQEYKSFAIVLRSQNNPNNDLELFIGTEHSFTRIDEIDSLLSSDHSENKNSFILVP